MITLDDLLVDENISNCLASFHEKRDGTGPDGMRVSELDDYWSANQQQLERKLRDGTYEPGIVRLYDVPTKSGKQRKIGSINVIDRFVEKLIQLKLRSEIEPLFLPLSFAYQEGKGTLAAAMQAREYIQEGNVYLCELDIRDYFGSIHLGRLKKLCKEHFDRQSMLLLENLLSRKVEQDGTITVPDTGLLQGSAISPCLSNLYLHSFDQKMENMQLNWLRFSDNINVYCKSADEAQACYATLRDELGRTHQLGLNKKKSGIYNALDRRVLGYDLCKSGDTIEVRKHSYTVRRTYPTWHESVIHKSHNAYHIVQDGIITRQDYSLLFENDDEKHHIPVGITDQLNIYGSVTITPSALRTITKQGIRIAYLDDYGNLMGVYVPESHGKAADVFLRQCTLYNDQALRLDTARRMEIAAIHNMRENLRYYDRRGRADLSEHIANMTQAVVATNEGKDVNALMLIEARARKRYYEALGQIVSETGFGFAQRSKQPPLDPCNAMISFGNMVLYNKLLQIIWKTSLDPKIGIVHATNRRNYSLNLDFADIFKPVIVDKVILSLINRHEIRPDSHFRYEGNGVYLNTDGKRLMLKRLDQKLDARVSGKNAKKTYLQLLIDEVTAFQRLVREGEKYHPYKYY